MSAFNFSSPSRQSAKGIVVILAVSIYKVVKATIILIIAFFFKYFQSQNSIDFTNPIVLSSIFGLLLLFLVLAILKYRNFMFHVNDAYFILKKGIINKEEVSVAKGKIQNVYIKQNILQQLINVVSLSIETAGDDKTEIEITALSRDKAAALKQLLLSGGQPILDDQKTETDSPIYYKASLRRILLEGVSENHIKSFVLIFGFIIGGYNDLKEFIEQLSISHEVSNWFSLDNESFIGLLIFNAAIVVLLLFLSFMLSLVKILVQNFNLTVTRSKNGLEISKGLFNKISLGLIASRIQTTTVSTNRLKRSLGLYQLAFTQAMVNKKQRQKFNIIGLSKAQINELLNQFYPNILSNNTRHKPEIYFVYRILLISVIPLMLINTGVFFLPKLFFLLNIPILLFLALCIYFVYKKKYYSIDEQYIIVGGGGLIDRTTSYLEISKLQAVSIHQTIFQKRRGLASVKLFSASKSLSIPHIVIANARNIKNYLLFKVESENKDWM
jgi:putative membrane protein